MVILWQIASSPILISCQYFQLYGIFKLGMTWGVLSQGICLKLALTELGDFLASYSYQEQSISCLLSKEGQWRGGNPPPKWSPGEYGWYIHVLCISYDGVVARVCCWRNGRSEFLFSLSFLLIGEFNKLSQKISENRRQFKFLKHVEMTSST